VDKRYSPLQAAHLYTIQTRERRMLGLLKGLRILDLHSMRILEIGCGNGFWINEFIKWGADPSNITGVDLDPKCLQTAKQNTPETVTLRCVDGSSLPDEAGSYDIVLQSTLFTSVLDSDTRTRIASEMTRVLDQDGCILWYDFHVNNPNNSSVRRVGRSEIHRMFPECHVSLQPITLAPPLARLVAPWSLTLCHVLEAFRPLCTHYIGCIRKIPRQ